MARRDVSLGWNNNQASVLRDYSLDKIQPLQERDICDGVKNPELQFGCHLRVEALGLSVVPQSPCYFLKR